MITQSFSDKGSRNFGSNIIDYGYWVRTCKGAVCSPWTATKTVTVTLAATAGFDNSYIVRSGNLGPDTDLYLSPLAVGSGNVGEFILKNVGETFTLERTPSTTDLAAAQRWTQSTQFEVRVEDINMDGTADAYMKGITGTITNAVDQMIVSSTTANAAPTSIISVDCDFKNFFTPVMAWYGNPSHFDTKLTKETWIIASGTNIPSAYASQEAVCIARWGTCRSRDGSLTSFYGSLTACVLAVASQGINPVNLEGNPVSRTQFCTTRLRAFFGVVPAQTTIRSFADQLQEVAEFVTIWEKGEDGYEVEDLADVLETVLGNVTVGGYDFSDIHNDELDEADEQRIFEVH